MKDKLEHLLEPFLKRAEQLINRIELALPGNCFIPENFNESIAWRYIRRTNSNANFKSVRHVGKIQLNDLKEIDIQKEKICHNTEYFINNLPANNVLLTGARGTGKSSLIRACLNKYASFGLRLIEIDKKDLIDLPDILEIVSDRNEKFIIFCDDLSFEEGEGSYKALKSSLDGTIVAPATNVLIYATSNRRHLLPEYMHENATSGFSKKDSIAIHPSEIVEEKVSLSERFGLWLSFYPFSQDEYLNIAMQWLAYFKVPSEAIYSAKNEALAWALERGARNGRVAYQFAQYFSSSIAISRLKSKL